MNVIKNFKTQLSIKIYSKIILFHTKRSQSAKSDQNTHQNVHNCTLKKKIVGSMPLRMCAADIIISI